MRDFTHRPPGLKHGMASVRLRFPAQEIADQAQAGGLGFFRVELRADHIVPVSYTHLDVYKRQIQCSVPESASPL